MSMKAVVASDDYKPVLKDMAIPKPGAGEALVKIKAVAINPTDWKHFEFKLMPKGSISGCDLAGEVIELGPDCKNLQKGDTVFTPITGGSEYHPDNGAFAEYAVVRDAFTLKSPKEEKYTSEPKAGEYPGLGPVKTFEQASAFGISFYTVVPAFEYHQKIPFRQDSAKFGSEYYLVWGGASAVGLVTIQLAKYVGFKVLAVASKKHEKLLKEYGAETVFDYHDEDVIEQIKKYTGDKVKYALDSISEGSTPKQVYDAVSSTEPANIAHVLPVDDNINYKKNVEISNLLSYLAWGDDAKNMGMVLKAPPGLHDATATSAANFQTLYDADPKLLKALPIQVLEGIEQVPKGLEMSKKGVHALKVIVTISKD